MVSCETVKSKDPLLLPFSPTLLPVFTAGLILYYNQMQVLYMLL